MQYEQYTTSTTCNKREYGDESCTAKHEQKKTVRTTDGQFRNFQK